jgi:MoxR-like ATPase
LQEAGKAFAAMDGRGSVSEEDVQRAAIPVLRHRIGTNFQAQAEGKNSEDIILQLLRSVGPREEEKYTKRRK